MRIAVTVEAGDRSEDLIVECGDHTTIEELECALHLRVGHPVRIPGHRRDPVVRSLVQGALLGRHQHRPTVRPRGWQLHVVSGPDCGGIWDLASGEHVVGRSGGICWNDPSMSRRHAALHVAHSGVTVTDLGSTHGSRLQRSSCASGARLALPVDAALELGASVAVLREAPRADGAWEPAEPGWRHLLRPPRLPVTVETPVIEIPEPPVPPEKRRLPAAALAVPLVLAFAIAAVLRRPEYLLFAAASPAMVLANHVASRVGTARRFAGLHAAHADQVEAAHGQLADAIGAEEEALNDRQPDAALVLLTATLPGRRLWERRPSDPDFLRLRVGTADQPSAVRVHGEAPDGLIAHGVPQCVDLGSDRVVGIAGDTESAEGVLRWLIAQLVVHQAPQDLALVFLGAGADDDWAWLRWLPHVQGRSGPALGTTAVTIAEQVSTLEDLIRARHHQRASRGIEDAFGAIVVVVQAFGEVSRLAGLRTIVEQGPEVGVHLLCTAHADGELPDSARVVVAAGSQHATRGSLSAAARSIALRLERVSIRWAEQLARALSPYRDTSTARGASWDEGAGLGDLLGFEPCASEIAARWREQPCVTRLLLGMGPRGPLAVDLRSDGPHALVAGMTGSGKTVLLQTMITSLALTNRPDRVNFVLIDYKGDSAFQECARLPHVVGKVTDLDPPTVQRALTSLRAELDRRKAMLAEAGARDVDEYHRLAAGAPLPRLVLVVDEFAELVKELPDFVEGLVTIAQLGRSLGIHLVLATQRPSGVISPAIRANTNIRIALRVVDAADSSDVIGVPDAALIPAGHPGRGYLALGAQPAVEFQSARVTRRRRDHRAEDAAPVIRPAWSATAAHPDADDDIAADVAALVEGIRAAAEAESVAPQSRPWLDPLPTDLPWSSREPAPMSSLRRFPFGVADLPDRQSRELACFDLDRDGHVCFIGAPRSGRSEALRVLATAIAELADPADVHLYAVDGGAGALAPLARLPHCGAVVRRHETERMGRLLARMTAELDRRQVLGGREASPRLVLLIDRWEGLAPAFTERSAHMDAIIRLLREGASVGIHLVISGDRTLLANSRVSAMTEARYLLRLGDRADYALAGLSARAVSRPMPPGRCFGPSMVETQIFRLDVDPTVHAPGSGPRPFRVDALPAHVSVAEAIALAPRAAHPVPIVGVGGDELSARVPDIDRARCFAVIGPARSGRTSVLAAAVESVVRTGGEAVVLASVRSPLWALADHPDVRAVIDHDAERVILEAALADTEGRSLLLAVDDADELGTSPLGDVLVSVARGQVPGVFLMVSGSAQGLGPGLDGWRAELRRARQGLLLSPRSLGDGDLIGARLTRDLIGGPIRPGRGLLHGGDALEPVTTVTPSTDCP